MELLLSALNVVKLIGLPLNFIDAKLKLLQPPLHKVMLIGIFHEVILSHIASLLNGCGQIYNQLSDPAFKHKPCEL